EVVRARFRQFPNFVADFTKNVVAHTAELLAQGRLRRGVELFGALLHFVQFIFLRQRGFFTPIAFFGGSGWIIGFLDGLVIFAFDLVALLDQRLEFFA